MLQLKRRERLEQGISFHSSCEPLGYAVMFTIFSAHWDSEPDGNASRFRQEELQENGKEADSDGEYSPQQPLPGGRYRVGFNLVSWGHVLFCPGGNRAVIECLNFSPSHKGEKRLVIRVVHEDVFHAIAIGMFQHGSQ